MTTTPTISKGERERWKRETEAYGHTGKDVRLLRLLDALEAAEARNEKAEALSKDQGKKATEIFDEAVRQKARAIKAEQERNLLANRLASIHSRFDLEEHEKGRSTDFWLEWAAQKDGGE